MFLTLLHVALGGAIGAVLRFATNIGAQRLLAGGFPYATVVVNVLGSFAMGLLSVALAKKNLTALSPFLMTGILGGFTTFSAFSLDAVTLWEQDQQGLAFLYVSVSVLVSLGALAAGMALARSLT